MPIRHNQPNTPPSTHYIPPEQVARKIEAKAARCGLELIPALATVGIRIRAGIHVGECEKRGDEWSGMAVHVGARISAMARADEVLTSRTVRDLSAGSTLRFESLGPQVASQERCKSA